MTEALDKPGLVILGTQDLFREFYANIQGISNLDYDMHTLIGAIINALDSFDQIDIQHQWLVNDALQTYAQKPEDEPIVLRAVEELFRGVRAKVDFFDIRDEVGILNYRFAMVRNDNIELISKGLYLSNGNTVVDTPVINSPRQFGSLNDFIAPMTPDSTTDTLESPSPHLSTLDWMRERLISG